MAACPNCGNTSAGKRFCTQCGTKLSKTPLQTVPAAPVRTAAPPDAPGPKSRTEELPGSSFGAAPGLDASARFSEISSKPESSSRLALLLVGPLLLLAGGIGGGVWWYLQKGGTEQVASTSKSGNDSAKSSQQTGAVSDQTPTRDRNPSGSSPTPSSSTTSLPTSSYLWEVITEETSGTTDEANALGATDAQTARIKPGAQLALAYREGQFFSDGNGVDVRVFGPPQELVSYTIFVRDDPAAAWKRIDINRKGFPQGVAGHDMGHHRVRQARQILIKNNGNTDLSIDAISALYKEVVSPKDRPHRPQ